MIRGVEPVLHIRSRPGPYQVMFLVAAIVGGASLLVLRERLGSTLAVTLPSWVTIVLSSGLLITAGVALFGTIRQSIVGMLMERLGVAALGALLLVYSGFTLHYTGLRGLVTVIFFVAIAGASAWRAVQISHSLNEIRKAGRRDAGGTSP